MRAAVLFTPSSPRCSPRRDACDAKQRALSLGVTVMNCAKGNIRFSTCPRDNLTGTAMFWFRLHASPQPA